MSANFRFRCRRHLIVLSSAWLSACATSPGASPEGLPITVLSSDASCRSIPEVDYCKHGGITPLAPYPAVRLYKIEWLTYFTDPPNTISVTVYSDGTGRSARPTRLGKIRTRALTSTAVQAFERPFQDVDFDSLPYEEPNDCVDSTVTIVSRAEMHFVHAVRRGCGDYSAMIRRLRSAFLAVEP